MALSLLGDSSDLALRNAIISACGRGFQWQLALELLPSDSVGYCAAMSACRDTLCLLKAS